MNSFYTDVIMKDQRFAGTERISDILLLERVTRQLVQQIISDAKAHGMNLMVFETYRSTTRQKQLFEQGATQLLNVGVHHYGLACDLVKNINGDPSWKGDFSLLGHLARTYNLIWGGDWGTPQLHHTLIDNVHLQRCSVGRQASLFNQQWYPDADYNPYQDLKNN